ncbi:MAG TPA: PPE domain-containing protein [Actinophytocola sp.]|uniref:PPE domain-containing protein n=1 Tax=Actinophytocola sp. TaxID=1872138 RepID=UPI002DB5E7BA|nr:PPE domain-containing protein [Actinophytocola sp.]HEU5474097.1 PPE domain-containing protein [Actinophytocola sp.]
MTARWRGHSHPELYDMIHSGPGPAASGPQTAYWNSLTDELSQVDADLNRALGELGARWTGAAAENATTSLTPLQAWASDAQTGSRVMAISTDSQAEYVSNARSEMPKPVEVTTPAPSGWDTAAGVGAALLGNPGPAAAVAAQQADHERQEAAQAAAAERAVDTMNTYESNSTWNRNTLGTFVAPPDVVISVAGAPGGSGVGGEIGSWMGGSTAGLAPGGTGSAGGTITTPPAPGGTGGPGGPSSPAPVPPGGVGVVPVGTGPVGGTDAQNVLPLPAPAPPGLPGPGPVPGPGPGPGPIPGPGPGPVPIPPPGGGPLPPGPGPKPPIGPVPPGGPNPANSGPNPLNQTNRPGGNPPFGPRGGGPFPGGPSGFGPEGRAPGTAGFGPGGSGPHPDSGRPAAAAQLGRGGATGIGGPGAGGTAGAGGSGAGGARGGGMGGAPMGGGRGQGGEDEERFSPDYLLETTDVFGDDRMVSPAVIGEDPSQEEK